MGTSLFVKVALTLLVYFHIISEVIMFEISNRLSLGIFSLCNRNGYSITSMEFQNIK
ncbi:MAG: hypothetical protein HW406_1502 [Candidatus Brocadiaceae bacterium]|nr:hypothetical protein [Candidatus Brocadiaceae bacterium]